MSSELQPRSVNRLISQLLLEDADLRDIVEEFVSGLTGRIQELTQAHAKMDFEQLAILTHRLKGAAGSYGYPDISQLCAQMESLFRAHETGGFSTYVAQLDALARAARVGLEVTP